jgi:uncharacterized protein (DUF1697 family)
MPAFIALYRGINVVGRNSVKMESLRLLHERLGHANVRNYIQSGNIVFGGKGSAAAISSSLATAFAEQFGFVARVIVVEAKRWATIVNANPYAKFSELDPKIVHLALCMGKPNGTGLNALLSKTGGRETFEISKDVLYLHAPDGYGTSKFAAGMERAAGVPMTVRNWRTVATLHAMVEEIA